MRRAILFTSLILCVLCIAYFFYSNGSKNVYIVTQRNGSTVEVSDIRLCTPRWLLADIKSGNYEFDTPQGKINLSRDFDSLQSFEITEGCDDQESHRYKSLFGDEGEYGVPSAYGLNKRIEELEQELKTLQKGKTPDAKKVKEIQDSISRTHEQKRIITPLRIKVTYDNGDTLEGRPEDDITNSKNYLRGDSDHGRVEILLSNVVSVVKQK